MRVEVIGQYIVGEYTIKEGSNIIYISINKEKNDDALDYVDKKYNEGWEIVAQGSGSGGSIDELILHKKK